MQVLDFLIDLQSIILYKNLLSAKNIYVLYTYFQGFSIFIFIFHT